MNGVRTNDCGKRAAGFDGTFFCLRALSLSVYDITLKCCAFGFWD
jgi:hypothetical protein